MLGCPSSKYQKKVRDRENRLWVQPLLQPWHGLALFSLFIMELNSASIHDVIHPTAGYSYPPLMKYPPSAKRKVPSPPGAALWNVSQINPKNRIDSLQYPSNPFGRIPVNPPSTSTEHQPKIRSRDAPWDSSRLNPKNRIDSLEYPLDPFWRIDGCTGLGTQYYATPLFRRDIPPMRFDVFIPEEAATSPVLRELLDLNVAFHTKDAARLRRLGIAKHIVRALQAWIMRHGEDMYMALCDTQPFGSRIIFENLEVDIRKIRISVVPTYYVERQLLSLAKVDQTLGIAPELVPPVVDITRLSIVRQLHDSVCLVRMHSFGWGDKLWILKALASGTKYLFLELRNLLQMEPHPNVIERPKYLVTKQCRFGGKKAVVGFLLPFHEPGSLRDTLPLLRIHNRLPVSLQLKWAKQLTSAVCHVRERGGLFYPDLRLDNILLSAAHDIVMVDFEQRGVWCEFAAPEVNAIEYVRILASDELSEGGLGRDHTISKDMRDYFASFLDLVLPDWQALQACEDYSAPRPRGFANYNIPWLALDETEQEAAMVYMLGRVLWCIFEGQCAPQKAAVWQSYRHEPDIEFPAFRLTPAKARILINHCTRGRRDALSGWIVRHGSKLVLRKDPDGSTPHKVRWAAHEWWRDEMAYALAFLRERVTGKERGDWPSNYFQRPTLAEVLAELEHLS